MQIQKNIAATLIQEMKARGQNQAEFSKELDIPRSTLQGYLKGRSNPRADSMEDIARKLGMTTARFISSPDDMDTADISSLERLCSEIQLLHPAVRVLADNAVFLLRAAFQISDELTALETHSTLIGPQAETYKYSLSEQKMPFLAAPAYGLLVKKCGQHGWETVAVTGAFSHSRSDVELLAEQCTENQIPPEKVMDAVLGFNTKRTLDA